MRLVVDPEDFLGNPSRRVLNISLVHTVLSLLSSPDNSLVFIGTQNNLSVLSEQFDMELSLDKTEPIYSTPFAIHDIPSHVVDHWSSSEGSTTELYLPGDNTFIPTNFDILPPPSTTNTSPVRIHSKCPFSASSSFQCSPLFLTTSFQLTMERLCGGSRTLHFVLLMSTCTVP